MGEEMFVEHRNADVTCLASHRTVSHPCDISHFLSSPLHLRNDTVEQEHCLPFTFQLRELQEKKKFDTT